MNFNLELIKEWLLTRKRNSVKNIDKITDINIEPVFDGKNVIKFYFIKYRYEYRENALDGNAALKLDEYNEFIREYRHKRINIITNGEHKTD
jgi:hypothetical protein